MFKLSMADSNDFVQSAVLDGTVYKLHFSWNSRASQWSVDIRNSSNEDIVRGIAIVPNFPLLHQYERNGVPMGELLAVINNQDADGSQVIGRDDFVAGKASIVYVPEVEVRVIMAASISS